MSIEALGAIGAPIDIANGLGASAPLPSPAGGFPAWIASEAGQVNNRMVAAQTDMHKLIAGEATSLHEVMIRMEEAKLSFQLLAQVRNRMLEAYQEVMRTQV